MKSALESNLLECRAVFEWDESKIEVFCHKHGTKIAEYVGDPEAFDLNKWTGSKAVQNAWKAHTTEGETEARNQTMKTLEVNVTQKNIDDGQRMTCCKCPIALAINTPEHNLYPRIDDASVHLKDGWFTRREKKDQIGEMFAFEMSKAATEFIESYQRKEDVAPFSFTLKLRPKGPRIAWAGTT